MKKLISSVLISMLSFTMITTPASAVSDTEWSEVFSEDFESYNTEQASRITTTADQNGWYLQSEPVNGFVCEVLNKSDNNILKLQAETLTAPRHQKAMNKFSSTGLNGKILYSFRVYVPSEELNPSDGYYNYKSSAHLQVNLEDTSNQEISSFYFTPTDTGVSISICGSNANTGADFTKNVPTAAEFDTWIYTMVTLDTDSQTFSFKMTDNDTFNYELPKNELMYLRNRKNSGFTGLPKFATAYLFRHCTNLLFYVDDVQVQQYVDPAINMIAEDKNALTLGFDTSAYIREDFLLPTIGSVNGSDISWSSNSAAISVSSSGYATINQTEDVQTATLTATLSLNGFSDTKKFTVKIAPKSTEKPAPTVSMPEYTMKSGENETPVSSPVTGFINTKVTINNSHMLAGSVSLVVASINKSTGKINFISNDTKQIDNTKMITLKTGIDYINPSENEYKYFIWNNGFVPVINCAPSSPSAIAFEPKATKINISWDSAFDDYNAIKEYVIYRNGTELFRTPSTNYTDEALQAETDYTYEIAAIDHESLVSEKVSGTAKPITMPGAVLNGDTQAEINSRSNALTFIVNNVMEAGDTYSISAVKKGVACRQTVERTSIGKGLTYLYFKTDKNYISKNDSNLTFTVTYFDEGEGNIYLDYNAIPAAGADPAKNNIAKRIAIANRNNTMEWKTVVFSVTDAQFREPAALSNCDFRFAGSDDNTSISFSEVRVIQTEKY